MDFDISKPFDDKDAVLGSDPGEDEEGGGLKGDRAGDEDGDEDEADGADDEDTI